MKRSVEGCGDTARMRLFEPRVDGTLSHSGLCQRHACDVLDGYVRESVSAKAPTSSINPAPFGLASIANFDQSDLSAVCLRSADGSCFFFAIGTFDVRSLLTVLPSGSKGKQAVSYEAVAAVAISLGAVLDHVVIDKVAEDTYQAKLKILRFTAASRRITISVGAFGCPLREP